MELKRIIAINDISGYGKCALTVTIPIVSAMGIEVCPVPTVCLSTNTKFKGFVMSENLNFAAVLEHFLELNIKADAIYTGFFTDESQIDSVRLYIQKAKPKKIIIDPIMGDDGKPYRTFSPELCAKIASLCRISDIVTPNITEAHILCGRAYDSRVDNEYIKSLAEEIKRDGAKTVIITGIERGNTLCNCYMDDSGYYEITAELLPFRMSGTGDMFASILTGAVVGGKSVEEAILTAQNFISLVMKKSREFEDFENRGPCFEPYLNLLS